MPLRFDTSRIENYDELFPRRIVTQEEATVFEPPGAYFHPVTNLIVCESIGIGIPRITAENAGEWYDRYVLLCGDWNQPPSLTREQVEQHIGLSTNVSPMTKRQWAAHRKRTAPQSRTPPDAGTQKAPRTSVGGPSAVSQDPTHPGPRDGRARPSSGLQRASPYSRPARCAPSP